MSAPASNASTEHTAKPTKPAKPKSRWWWRWTKRLTVAALVTRILLWLFLAQIANFGAGFAGLSVSWRSASLSLSGLSLHLEDLLVRDANDPDAPDLLRAQEVVADLSMRQLLSGQVAIVDAGIAGARITVQRGPDGTLRLPKAWREPAAVTLPEPEPEPVSDDAPLSFELPVWIASTRLHDLQVDFVDHSQNPPVTYSGKLDLDVADIGFPDRSGSVMVRFHAPQFCDELFVLTKIEASPSDAAVHFQATVRGFRPQQFDLPPQFLEVIENAHVVDVQFGGDLTAKVLSSAPKHPALNGSVHFGLSLDGIERSTLTSSFGPTEVLGAGTVDVALITPFELAMHTDGIIDALRLQNGRLELSGNRTAVTAELRGERLTATRIEPLLAAAGLQLPKAGIDFRTSLDADLGESMSLDVNRLTIASGDQPLLALDRIAVRDLRTVGDTLAIGSVEIVGPNVPLQRASDGSLQLGGLRWQPPTASATDIDATPTVQPTAGQTATAMVLPKIRLGSLAWSGAQLAYTDNTFEPAATLRIDDLRVQGDAITIGEDAPPGRLTVSFALPDIAERCTAELNLKSNATGLHTELQWQTTGVTLRALEPWLEPLGIASELNSGELRFAVTADVELAAAAMRASVQLVNLQFQDGDRKLLALRSLSGTGIELGGDASNLGTWEVLDPYLLVQRDTEQLLHVVGLRLGSTQPIASSAANSAANSAAKTDPSESPIVAGTSDFKPTPSAKPAVLPQPIAAAVHPKLAHGELRIDRTTIALRDARFAGRTFAIGLDAKVGASSGSEPLPVNITLRLDRAMQSCNFDAQVQLAPEVDSFVGKLRATGIQGAELAMLLPAGLACSLVDGSLDLSFEASMQKANGSAVQSSLRGLKLKDRGSEVLAVDEVVFHAPTVTSDEVHIADAHVSGVRAIVTMTDAALHVPGFAIANNQPAVPSAPQPAKPASEPPGGAPVEPLTLPKLRIDNLLCELERLEVRDRRGEDSEPLLLRTSLKLREPWLSDPAADEPTPMRLLLSGDCQPLGAKFTADTRLSLFDLTPTLDVEFLLQDFDTTQLQRVMPPLGAQVRGEATALSAKATLHATLNMKRRDPSLFDFSRTLGAEVIISDVVLKDAKTEQPYASIANIDAIARAIHPASGSLLLRSLTIDDPKFRVWKDHEGTHVAGFLLPLAAPTSPTADVVQTAPSSGETTASVNPTQPSANEVPELAIDRFDLLGLSVDYQDSTTEPATHLNLTDTDVQLKRFSTRALTEALPMSFTVAVRGGPVQLERRIVNSSVLAGLVTSSAQALVGANQAHDYEQRPMLDELTAAGQLQLFPTTSGRVNITMTDLELAAFRGLAKQAGVDLTDGLYDMRVGIDLRGYDGIKIRSQHVFTYLALDEPPDGPIYRYLRLPAPIQSVLFLLRNQDDQQRIPISLTVPADGVSQSAIVNLAVENLIKLIGDAFGGATGRLLSTGTGGLLGGSSDVPDIRVEIPFAAGSPLPDSHELQALVAAARDDESLSIVLTHEMGSADQAEAERLANPNEHVVSRTIKRLQQQRAQLERERTPIAERVVALYAAGKSQEAVRAQAHLHELDTRLGGLISALDEAITQLGNHSVRDNLRRTRRAAVALAESRLDAVSQDLLKACPALQAATPSDQGPRIERRPGRGVPVAGLDGGGRVLAVLRRRAALALPSERPVRTEQVDSSVMTSGFTAVPPVADPSNRPFNRR